MNLYCKIVTCFGAYRWICIAGLWQVLGLTFEFILQDCDMFWDFLSLRPESTHQVMFLFSDRGIPDGHRHMNGYGSHTFKAVNDKNEAVYVKFHYKVHHVWESFYHFILCDHAFIRNFFLGFIFARTLNKLTLTFFKHWHSPDHINVTGTPKPQFSCYYLDFVHKKNILPLQLTWPVRRTRRKQVCSVLILKSSKCWLYRVC